MRLEIAALKLENKRLSSQCQAIELARARKGNSGLSKSSDVNSANDALELFANPAYSTAYCDLIVEYERSIFLTECRDEREAIYERMVALQQVTLRLNSMIKYASLKAHKAA